ncbi:MAG TPA: endolytic transglycosylase MltG [Candidatus Saccharimonadales bacterium]|nr:endolytic transglycosylase MltG [Candidatus Saccharimonadales bacterium]
MRYTTRAQKHHWPRRLVFILVAATVAVVAATVFIRRTYFAELRPVSATQQAAQLVTVKNGSSVDTIAKQLSDAKLIRSAWAFKLYVSSKEVRDALQAGTYLFSPSQSVGEIVSGLTHGKVATNLVTILPGQRIDLIRGMLIGYGFKAADVDAALNPDNHLANPALVDKPNGASLEGFIYPDSYEKTSLTTPQEIIEQSLGEMGKQLSPDVRDAFAEEGLSTYQGLVIASIVEKEVSNQSDRYQVAQVFIKRLKSNMMLGSDVTAYYGAIVNHAKPSTTYDSPYNTLLHTGLPPTPISNVSASSLKAVAHPADTDWLYFVTGDDGTTHFSRTLDEHNAATQQYCHKLCGQ